MTDFSHRLKELRKNAHLNQVKVAIAIGVAQTAIANYESGKRFPSEDKLIKLAELFDISLDVLLGREPFVGRSDLYEKMIQFREDAQFFINLGDDLTKMLVAGKRQEFINCILSLNAQGLSLQDIYHKIFQYILYKTGWLWESKAIDVTMEHFISQTLEQMMPVLMGQAKKKPPNGHKVICFTPVGEDHIMVNHMISDFLELEGFECHFLGRNVPLVDLTACIERIHPSALVISVTLTSNIQTLEELIKGLAHSQGRSLYKIIIGGNPLRELTGQLGADAVGFSLEDTVSKVKALTGSDIIQGGQYV